MLDHLPDDAVVLLVGYPDPLPTTGRYALLGGAETRRAALVVEGIDRVMAEVADQLDRVEYLSVVKAFADHHACADRPWIRGFDPKIRIPSMEVLAASYHPNPAGVAGYAGVLAPSSARARPLSRGPRRPFSGLELASGVPPRPKNLSRVVVEEGDDLGPDLARHLRRACRARCAGP